MENEKGYAQFCLQFRQSRPSMKCYTEKNTYKWNDTLHNLRAINTYFRVAYLKYIYQNVVQ